MPLTVGGGVRTPDDMVAMLKAGRRQGGDQHRRRAGARPYPAGLCPQGWLAGRGDGAGREAAHGDGWGVYTHGGRNSTGLDAVQFAKRAAELGAGEILLTSMDRDGDQGQGMTSSCLRADA
jgi:cyclase